DVTNPVVGLGPGQALPGLERTGRGGDGKTEGHLVCGGSDPGNEHVGEGDMGGRGVAHVTKLPCSRYSDNRAYVRGTHAPRGVRPASARAPRPSDQGVPMGAVTASVRLMRSRGLSAICSPCCPADT